MDESPRKSTPRREPKSRNVDGTVVQIPSILGVLAKHQVRFIIIGGVAAGMLGSPSLTGDLDICYDRSRDNLQLLAAALRELGATLRGAEPGLPFQLDATTLHLGDSFTFQTVAGPLDILGTPSGTTGYSDLIRSSEDYELGDQVVKVTSLDDLMRMKKAAGRAKDRIELEILGALRDEIDGES